MGTDLPSSSIQRSPEKYSADRIRWGAGCAISPVVIANQGRGWTSSAWWSNLGSDLLQPEDAQAVYHAAAPGEMYPIHIAVRVGRRPGFVHPSSPPARRGGRSDAHGDAGAA